MSITRVQIISNDELCQKSMKEAHSDISKQQNELLQSRSRRQERATAIYRVETKGNWCEPLQ